MTNTKALDLAVRRMTHKKDRKTWERCVERHFTVPNTVALKLRHKFVSEYRRIIEADAVCDAHKYLAAKAASVGITPPAKLP